MKPHTSVISFLFAVVAVCPASLFAQKTVSRNKVQPVRVCALAEAPEKFLNATVEVNAAVFFARGNEFIHLVDAGSGCSFRYAFGNESQGSDKTLLVKEDQQWKLLKKLLSSTECASDVRIARATVRGVVIEDPEGKKDAKKPPYIILIQAVSGVRRVSRNCTLKTQTPHS